MTDSEQREAARQFTNKWRGGGDEKQDCHCFWIELLQNVLGVGSVTDYIQFEKPVKLPEADGKVHTRYIDGYIPAVKVLIEQKGSSHPLEVPEPQSGGEMLTPYQQAKRYNDNLPLSEKARWIVICNFTDLWIYDMEQTVPTPQKVEVVDLRTKYPLLDFLVKKEVKELSHEMEVSIKAGDIVGLIYDAFLKQYGIPESAPKGETEEEKQKREHKLRSLNALCVRLVFLFYAEDAGIFERNQFHDYLAEFPASQCRVALIRLFRVLDQKPEERDEYLESNLAAFPYVNGGLFSDENIIIPPITDEIKDLLLKKASEGFDWRDISPTIFGAVFESTLNPETRRKSGAHFTSIQNIHKVIDPLFLDDLKAEFEEIRKIEVRRTKRVKLDAFQKKLASLTFFDPASGSGNFLTESYISIRRLENEVIREKTGGQISFGSEDFNNPIKVSIRQFYGCEILDFAVTVAKTALWIAESQMLEETKSILYGFNQDFLPLKTYVNITEGNALRLDWEEIVPKDKLNYIMGNPPFVGNVQMSGAQKADMDILFSKKEGRLDYVSAWYVKAIAFIQNTNIKCAFVSTNSITQGVQVPTLWGGLKARYEFHIYFAYSTFVWTSEAALKAAVHCVIIGFAYKDIEPKYLFSEGEKRYVKGITFYMTEGSDFIVKSASHPICDVPKMVRGNQPSDGGWLILSEEEKNELLEKEPNAAPYVKQFMMGREFINHIPRYCLWLVGVNPKDLRSMPLIMERVKKCKEARLKAPAALTRSFAETPMLFGQRAAVFDGDYIALGRVSSQNRRYVPMDFLTQDVIAGDKLYIIPNGTIYMFGILMSNVHNAWLRMFAGRMKSDYSYSTQMVYNTFPWPSPTEQQKAKIEQTAQSILDARSLYPDSSLADLYDPLTMPPELRKAHTANDIAVMKAYGFSTKMSESDCVATLMEMYQKLVEEKGKKAAKK